MRWPMIHNTHRARQSRDVSLVLDLLAMSLEAGLDFNVALDRVAELRLEGEVGQALENIRQQIALGASRTRAFEDSQERHPIHGLDRLTLCLHLSEALGAPLSATLQHQAQGLRRERLALVQKLAHEVPVKMLFPLVFLIFPCTMLVLFGPILLQLLASGLF